MGRGHQAGGEFRVEKTTSDTDFVQITATTDYATGQALLYADRAGYVWQFDFSKQRWEILPTTRA
jgi:hypothetical protein